MVKQYPFAAIIFDHDGTLIDTETPDFEACQILFGECGLELRLEHWAETVIGRMDGYDRLFGEVLADPAGQALSYANLWARIRELWPQTLVNTRLMPGVETLLSQLRTEGYRLGVATAADQGWVTRWLGKFDLLPYFEIIASGDQVARNKPAPDVYLRAAELLEVAPQRCLVFEDSVAGVQAAKAAGMTVVAVPSHLTRSLDFSRADASVPGLDQVSLNWIEQFGRNGF